MAEMKLISVNVGEPREIDWKGKKIRTAIWKEPVQGRIPVGPLGLPGDLQADLVGHGGENRALMVYQMQSYQYWQDQLNRTDFTYGQFGENLTVDGLEDDQVCIGDRYRIGSAIFEVTQPRVTCYKVGIRMNEPQMPALLVAHRRPGFYFRVIQPGEIEAGDAIERVSGSPQSMTVADVDILLYSSDHPVASLQKALGIPALSQGWRASFQELLKAASSGNSTGNAGLVANPSPSPAWAGFRPLRVRVTKQESLEVRSFELAAEDGSALPDPLPGQHIAVKIPVEDSSPSITRMYSLCGPTGLGTYRIAVKHENNGKASTYLHEHLNQGDILLASAPRGTFTLKSGANPVVLLSAGVGITPLLGMLYGLNPVLKSRSRDVWWIHSTQNGVHHSFSKEVEGLMAESDLSRRVRIYSRPTTEDLQGRDFDRKGRVDLAMLQSLRIPQEGEFYLCGPEAYLDALQSDLMKWGIPSSQIHVEAFSSTAATGAKANSSAPHLPLDDSGTGPQITFAQSGISFRWNQKFTSLLDAAEACDVPVRWSCRSGVCHSCESGLIVGELKYSPDPIDPPPAGRVLICCAVPVSNVELDL